jgi:hypothetical protein
MVGSQFILAVPKQVKQGPVYVAKAEEAKIVETIIHSRGLSRLTRPTANTGNESQNGQC